MKNIFFLLLLFIVSGSAQGASVDILYLQLEECLAKRPEYAQNKEARIDSIEKQWKRQMPLEQKYQLCFKIFQEYYTYRSDSAFYYIDMAYQLAQQLNRPVYKDRCIIHKSLLLSTTGYFSQAKEMLDDIDRAKIAPSLLAEYYEAYEWVYSVWSEYLNDDLYSPTYRNLEIQYTDSLLSVLPPKSARYYYWRGEYLARTGKQDEAEKAYQKALKGLPQDTRLYACVTCGIAFTYMRRGEMKEYERYLIMAAISDMICPLKENLAMQELAMYIFKNKDGDLERANRYLNVSMEDAMFYNNRLRMLEIARKFPSIVSSYQEQSNIKNRRMTWAFVFICILSAGLVVSLIFIRQQVKQIRLRRRAIAEMNQKLRLLNQELLHTNRSREEYISLFLDLCAAYIDKLSKYQELVRRKVKAKQIDDLLKIANSTKMPESDAKHFFVNFDTAFLTLYPNFIKEFNELLREGEEIEVKRGELLNTELRIFALIRMGVKDSSRIATLLFYSPQTIYNYRTAVRNRARDRENFEEQVKQLCPIMENKEE
jgi:tetratricopeptide (TPR) repeat protein